MRLVIVIFFCLVLSPTDSLAQSYPIQLPKSARLRLDRRLPGWKFVDVSPEIRQFFKDEMKGVSPVVISGDFDGNRSLDYAALVERGHVSNPEGKPIGPLLYLVVFMRRANGYKMHVIKDVSCNYISIAKKGTLDYNYETQKEITYENDAILTSIFEKAGSSYVYKKGRFISFISSD